MRLTKLKLKLVIGILSVFVVMPSQAQLFCQNILTTSRDEFVKMYPKGIDPALQPNGFIQISYESEYLFSEAGQLLNDYAPPENILARAQWLAMSSQAKIAWIQARFKNKPEHAVAADLVRIVNTNFLPKELIVDSTGNLEIVIDPPLSSYEEWQRVVDYIVNRYGAGSQQAMMSKPREAAFATGARGEVLFQQHFGWLIYTNLYDTFVKLKSGFQRYQKDPTQLTALSFDHPFLGPMVRAKRDVMELYLNENAKNEKYDDDSKKFVRKSDASFKYTSGPSYRPDIAGPGRWSWEIRNAHKDVQGLKDKVMRDARAHMLGLDDYASFSKVSAFDTVAEFNKLSPDMQKMLQQLFPSKADPRFDYNDTERLVLETFRNFSLPMMNFESLVSSLSADPAECAQLNRLVTKARMTYFNELQATSNLYASKRAINAQQAKAKVMGLLGQWSVESGLSEAFEKFAKNIHHDPRYAKNIETKKLYLVKNKHQQKKQFAMKKTQPLKIKNKVEPIIKRQALEN